MLLTPIFLSPAQTFFLSSGLVYPTAYTDYLRCNSHLTCPKLNSRSSSSHRPYLNKCNYHLFICWSHKPRSHFCKPLTPLLMTANPLPNTTDSTFKISPKSTCTSPSLSPHHLSNGLLHLNTSAISSPLPLPPSSCAPHSGQDVL